MIINDPKHLAIYVQDVRKSQGESQTVLGARVGMKQSTVSAFENKPEASKLETVFRLLAANNLAMHLYPKGQHPEADKFTQEW